MYKVLKDKIVILNKDEFCPKHILECGQIFSYKIINNNYVVYSANKMAKITETKNGYEILTKDVNYFINFFDLNTNYTNIKNKLIKQHSFLKDVINFGYGIRILNQDALETIISFIVSANNNIKRIQKILFAIRENFGTNMGSFYAFPTLNQLQQITVQNFKDMGAGYRAEYLVKTISQLKNLNYLDWINLNTNDLNTNLLSLMGVGQKVADCIMLFAYKKKDVFPVDTWIQKVYNTYFNKEQNRKKIRKNLLDTFGENSGYAQQYLFYSQRSFK